MNENQNEYVDINTHDNYPDSEQTIEVPTMKVAPIKKICMTIGQLPTSYIETMSYYEMLIWFIEFLRNNVIPTVNNNGEAVQELQGLFIDLQTYINNFKDSIDTDVEDLETYINNYFENLDVQDEINNKIDDMIDNGTFNELIENYMSYKYMTSFSNGLSQGGNVSGYQNEINIPAGTYNVTTDTNFFKTNFTTDSTSLIVIASNGSEALRNISFIDCIFDKVGFQLYQKGHYIFKNCTFINTLNSAITNASSDQTIDIINCNFIDNAPNVDEWNTNASSVQSWKYTPINIYGNELTLNVKNCTFKNIMAGSCIYKPTTTTGLNFLIENSTFENLCGNGISLNTASYGKILNNKFLNVGGLKNTGSYQSTITGVGMNAIYCTNESSEISVIGNYIENVGENGIEGAINTITDNIIMNTGYRYGEGYTTPSTEGIYAMAKIISGNKLINTRTHGIVLPQISVSKEYCYVCNNEMIGTNNGHAIIINIDANSQNTIFKIYNNKTLKYTDFIFVFNNSSINANVEMTNNTIDGTIIPSAFNKLGGFHYSNTNKKDINFKNPNFLNVTDSTINDWRVSAGTLVQVNNGSDMFGRLTAGNEYCNMSQTIILNGDHNIICIHIKAKATNNFNIALVSKDFNNATYTTDTFSVYSGVNKTFTADTDNFKDYYFTDVVRGNVTLLVFMPTTNGYIDIKELSCEVYDN